MASPRKVQWTKQALRQLETAMKYILRRSPQNADAVKAKILEKTANLADDRTVHRKDPYKAGNDGSFLFFEIFSYRIVYRVVGEDVFIVRLVYTSQEPGLYRAKERNVFLAFLIRVQSLRRTLFL